MRVVVTSEMHFGRGPDGRVYTDDVYPYAYWQRLLGVFDQVTVLARVAPLAEPGGRAVVDGDGVTVAALPSVRGPAGLVRALPEAAPVIAAAASAGEAFLLRAPGVIATMLWPLLRVRRRAYGVQVVGDPHESLRTAGAARAFQLALAWQLRLQIRGAAALTYVTRETMQRRYPPPPGRPAIAVSEVELADSLFERDVPVARAVAPGDPIRVGFVGSLARAYKGLDVLIGAAAQAPRLHVTVVGEGPMRAELEARARGLGVAARVDFRGTLAAGAPVLDFLASQDVFALPSRTEGLPRVVLEAMAVGVPCVATPVGGVPELLDADALVPVDDAGALAARLVRFADDLPLRQAQVVRNRAIAADYRATRRDARLRAFYQHVRDAAVARGGRSAAAPHAGSAA